MCKILVISIIQNKSQYHFEIWYIFRRLTPYLCNFVPSSILYNIGIGMYHSNYLYQCTILAADFVIFYYGIKNDQAIRAGAGSE